jgi:CubicO group peptidase (beta-lactamase class C family)
MHSVAIACLLAAACGKATEEPSPAPAGSGSAPAKPAAPSFEALDRAIAPNEAPNTTSVLVMKRGKILHETYVGGATVDTLHDTRSVGKSLTALAIGIAIDRKVLPGVEARVLPYLADLKPANPGAAKDAITVEDFLTMSSALDCNDDDDKSPGNEENMYPLPVWSRWAVDLPTRRDYARDASGRGPWHYCTAGTFLLGQVIQRAATQPVDAFLVEHLFAPLRIAQYQFAKSPTGEVMTGGGLRLRTRDFAAVAELVRARGMHDGKQVISRAFVERALTKHRMAFPKDEVGYGYLWWNRIHDTPCGKHAAWYMRPGT